MRGGELLDKMELVDPVYVEEADQASRSWIKPWIKPASLAACFLLVAVSVVAVRLFSQPALPISQSTIAAESPGLRKFLNYNGCQYVFIENGSTFDLTQAHLGEALGHLEYDILADREKNSCLDYAATFAVGGTIYRMTCYEPDFRVAVEFQGDYYICEKTGHTDGSDLDVDALFETAGFRETVTDIILYDHFGQNELGRLSGQDVRQMVALLAQVSPASLTNEDYEKIAKAQKSGESFLVVFQLADTTRYKLYVIPSLSIAMIGSDRFLLPAEFHSAFDSVFDSLCQAPVERIP